MPSQCELEMLTKDGIWSVICPNHTLSAHHHLDHLPKESRSLLEHLTEKKEERTEEKLSLSGPSDVCKNKYARPSLWNQQRLWFSPGLAHFAYSFFAAFCTLTERLCL